MKILITGPNSNTARGLIPRLLEVGHDLVLTDLTAQATAPNVADIPYFQLDVQIGVGLERAAQGCDAILHLPAWHGIHWNAKTETDFWRLNVDGTFWMFQAAQSAGVRRVVFLSSQAWHGHYDKYGFTKRIGEELCEYNRQRHSISYVAVRPADFTPWADYLHHYGPRLLHGGVDREDVMDCIHLSLDWLARPSAEMRGGHVDAIRHDPYGEDQLQEWEKDSPAVIESLFPGSLPLLTTYGIQLREKPEVSRAGRGDLAAEIGYRPSRHFGTFIEELRALDTSVGEAAIRFRTCPY